jgi:hypothetical protein
MSVHGQTDTKILTDIDSFSWLHDSVVRPPRLSSEKNCDIILLLFMEEEADAAASFKSATLSSASSCSASYEFACKSKSTHSVLSLPLC